MAKRKAKGGTGGEMPMSAYKPPSPARMIRMAAENAAHMAMESHPTMKKKRDEIATAVEETIKQKLGPVRKGRFS